MTIPICWLASYPKSGNTWIRFLIHQYLHGELHSSPELEQSIPDVHVRHTQLAGTQIGGMVVVKSHHRLTSRMPYYERTGRAIYVVRHPRSVLLSSLNYARLIAPSRDASLVDDEGYARTFIKLGGDPLFIQFGFGSMLEHAGSWLAQPGLERLIVRYEDMREAPDRELARMLHFLGVEPDADRLAAAVDASSFERMRSLETAEKMGGVRGTVFAGDSARAKGGRLFMNAGRANASLEAIAPGLDAEVDERFAWFLGRFGYERTSPSHVARTSA